MCFLSPTESTWASVQQGDWAPSAKKNLPDLLWARPGTGTVSLLAAQIWLESRAGMAEGGVAGCCLSEAAPAVPVSVLPIWNHAAMASPRSLVFSFPDEFLVRLARALVQPGCASSGEHPSSDNAVRLTVRAIDRQMAISQKSCLFAGRSWSAVKEGFGFGGLTFVVCEFPLSLKQL